jgi:transcriptional regulator with XRE-family HTH domain
MANTPPQLWAHGVDKHSRSRKLDRVVDAYIGPHKKKYKAIRLSMQHAGALAQKGDTVANRRLQEDLAASLGIARSTYTKMWMMFRAPGACPKCGGTEVKMLEDWSIVCGKCGPLPADWNEQRRLEQSEMMKTIIKSHPRWSRRKRRKELERQVAVVRRIRKHVAPLITRNAGWGEANSYAEAMPPELRPKIERQEDPSFEARVMAQQFGKDLFDPEAHKRLGVPTNGFDYSVGWNLDPKLPWLKKCVCRLKKSQRRFIFQKVCPKCDGRGFVNTGKPMPYTYRLVYQQLENLGLRKKISRCDTCNEIWDGSKQCCPKCGDAGRVYKEAGILTGWTQKKIAALVGCSIATVREAEHAYARLMIIRTVKGRVWRKCSKCKLEFSGRCKGCGAKAGKVERREPHKVLYLPDRTMDKDLCQSERNRLDAAVKKAERMKLQEQQQQHLVAAVELAKQVLGEWEGQEHYLESFWKEMHRRMAAHADHARLVNVLFPLQRE